MMVEVEYVPDFIMKVVPVHLGLFHKISFRIV